MPRDKVVAEALDRCLARLQSRTATVEDCLRDYPELAGQLAPLLRAALHAGELLSPAGPSEAFRAASQARLLKRLRAARAAGSTARRAPRTRLARMRPGRPAYALAGLALAVVLIGSSFAAASAAATSLPGDRLYGLKRGLEDASLALSPTRAGDAALLLGFAEVRLNEAEALIEVGREGDLPVALAGYERALNRLLALEGQGDGSLARLEAAFADHEKQLQRALTRAAPPARPAVERALERSQQKREEVQQLRQDQRPENVPPGQLKRTPSSQGEADGQPPGRQKTKTPSPSQEVRSGPKDRDER